MTRLGIDLGGTKIEIIALDESGAELMRRRVSTPQGDYQSTLQAVADLVQDADSRFRETCTVGIGTPGAISRATGLLKNSNSTCLNGQPIQQDLEALLKRPVRMANDANCFALSEATDGAAAGAEVVFGVIIGTGVGAGIVVNGKILNGLNSIGGEWGHNPLPWPSHEELPGHDCYCGKKGCIETWLSGPGMARHLSRTHNIQTDSHRIVAGAESGDPVCESALADYEDRLARSLAHVINILDPDVIVLGGGMSNIDRLYENIPLLLPQYVFSDRVDTRIVRNHYGDSSGVRGAAWLWG